MLFKSRFHGFPFNHPANGTTSPNSNHNARQPAYELTQGPSTSTNRNLTNINLAHPNELGFNLISSSTSNTPLLARNSISKDSQFSRDEDSDPAPPPYAYTHEAYTQEAERPKSADPHAVSFSHSNSLSNTSGVNDKSQDITAERSASSLPPSPNPGSSSNFPYTSIRGRESEDGEGDGEERRDDVHHVHVVVGGRVVKVLKEGKFKAGIVR